MRSHPRRIARSLAIVVAGAAASAGLVSACEQPVTPDPIDAGRLHRTSDAQQLDASRPDAGLQPDASAPPDAVTIDAPL
jgi:hypothetical protein